MLLLDHRPPLCVTGLRVPAEALTLPVILYPLLLRGLDPLLESGRSLAGFVHLSLQRADLGGVLRLLHRKVCAHPIVGRNLIGNLRQQHLLSWPAAKPTSPWF